MVEVLGARSDWYFYDFESEQSLFDAKVARVNDPVLGPVMSGVSDELFRVGFSEIKYGMANGTSWVEVSGRGPNGSWYVLKLHRKPKEDKLEIGLNELKRAGTDKARTGSIGQSISTKTAEEGPQYIVNTREQDVRLEANSLINCWIGKVARGEALVNDKIPVLNETKT